MIVLDASATIALLLNEDKAIATPESFLALVEDTVIAPSHWAAEVGNALVSNVRRRRLKPAQFDAMAEQLAELRITLDPPPDIADIATIAHQAMATGLTYYDAAYVHTARSRQASLFTFDQKMRDVATLLKIPILPG